MASKIVAFSIAICLALGPVSAFAQDDPLGLSGGFKNPERQASDGDTSASATDTSTSTDTFSMSGGFTNPEDPKPDNPPLPPLSSWLPSVPASVQNCWATCTGAAVGAMALDEAPILLPFAIPAAASICNKCIKDSEHQPPPPPARAAPDKSTVSKGCSGQAAC
jgi:hypothetical protein